MAPELLLQLCFHHAVRYIRLHHKIWKWWPILADSVWPDLTRPDPVTKQSASDSQWTLWLIRARSLWQTAAHRRRPTLNTPLPLSTLKALYSTSWPNRRSVTLFYERLSWVQTVNCKVELLYTCNTMRWTQLAVTRCRRLLLLSRDANRRSAQFDTDFLLSAKGRLQSES